MDLDDSFTEFVRQVKEQEDAPGGFCEKLEVGQCKIGDLVYLNACRERTQYRMSGRVRVIAQRPDTEMTLVENAMKGADTPLRLWIPADCIVRQVFSIMERRKTTAPWNF